MKNLTSKVLKTLPKYVRVGTSKLKLINESRQWGWLEQDNWVYFRDAGFWQVDFEIKNGKLFCVIPNVPHLHGKELLPSTYSAYKKDNAGYL